MTTILVICPFFSQSTWQDLVRNLVLNNEFQIEIYLIVCWGITDQVCHQSVDQQLLATSPCSSLHQQQQQQQQQQHHHHHVHHHPYAPTTPNFVHSYPGLHDSSNINNHSFFSTGPLPAYTPARSSTTAAPNSACKSKPRSRLRDRS